MTYLLVLASFALGVGVGRVWGWVAGLKVGL